MLSLCRLLGVFFVYTKNQTILVAARKVFREILSPAPRRICYEVRGPPATQQILEDVQDEGGAVARLSSLIGIFLEGQVFGGLYRKIVTSVIGAYAGAARYNLLQAVYVGLSQVPDCNQIEKVSLIFLLLP